MNDLNRKAFTQLLNFLVFLAVLLFLTAGTVHYWPAWIFLVVFSAWVLSITAYLVKNDPKLLERRGKAGAGAPKEKRQDTIQILALIPVFSTLGFPPVPPR